MKQKASPPDNPRHAANQRNAQHSTGPKTEAGKRASAQNALKFGFFSTKALLPGESAEAFAEFQAALWLAFGPRNALEAHLVEQYIALAWRLRRLPEIEAFAFTRYGLSVQGHQCGPGFALVASVQSDDILGQLARYEATLHKAAGKLLDQLRALREEGWEATPIIETEAVAVIPPASSPPGATDGPAPEVGPALLPPQTPVAEIRDPVSETGGSDLCRTNCNAPSQAVLPEDPNHE